MPKIEVINTLIGVAGVFSANIPDWLDDDVVVGKVAGLTIHAGEVKRLNRALDEIRKNPPLREQVVELLRSRQIIDAIKLVRAHTNLGLKEAKDYTDQIRAEEGL